MAWSFCRKSREPFYSFFDGAALITLNADLCGGRFGVFTEGSHADFRSNKFTDTGGIPCKKKMLFQRHGSRGPGEEGLTIYADSSVPAWRTLHAAYSDDLTNWKKVVNCKPLFLRGETASWDQGAIWWADTFPWSGKLYMLYEGWGSVGYTPFRDTNYYSEGHSQLGLAIATTNDFLDWSGLNNSLSPDILGH